jgi:hypothetical protein
MKANFLAHDLIHIQVVLAFTQCDFADLRLNEVQIKKCSKGHG